MWPRIFGLAMLSGVGLCIGWISASGAATSTTLDVLPDDIANARSSSGAEMGGIKPLTEQTQSARRPATSGNPLWSVPLSVLTATQERPLFSASRRPPPKPVIGPRIAPPPPPAPVVEKPPERPSLALIGAIVGDSEAIAVFLDQTNQVVVRLRQGETHGGWMMTSILQREVTLTKGGRTEVLALPSTGASPASSGPVGVPIVPAQAKSNGTPYAPFVPRKTPKNGESDGL